MAYQSEPGSFRDRHGRIYYRGDRVFRALSERSLVEWRKLSATRLFAEYTGRGHLISTELVSQPELSAQGWAGVLRHDRIPFVSYPYEWTFGMLKEAARLQLELVLAALEEDFALKDASSFNVQWFGSHPVFIDILSFESRAPGDPWLGYRQFCQLFLYPLFLQAYKNLDFHSWLRGSLEGISPRDCRAVMSFRDLLRRGVFSHVYVQSKLESRYGAADRSVRQELRQAGFSRELIRNNVGRLVKIIESLEWKRAGSTWSDYAREHSYSCADWEAKTGFVRNAVVRSRPRMVWDLGCNVGSFSRIAAAEAQYVVAMDADHLCVEHLFQSLRREDNRKILPLVSNLADPSPDLGWRCLERRSITRRARPDLVLALALIHHLVIGANIPVRELVFWLHGLGGKLVIEFVAKSDPMVQKLLRNKEDQYEDYEIDHFEVCLKELFQIEGRQALGSGMRFLYFAVPR